MLVRILFALAILSGFVAKLLSLNFVRSSELAFVQWQLDAIRSNSDVSPELVESFRTARDSEEYNSVFTESSPLVTVCVATYNRGPLLVERCLASIIRQDYTNLEILVVGDCCTDDTEERVAAIGDDRIRFVNLPERGRYPEEPVLRWMVAGTTPVNHALEMARGSFITHLDDDDEFTPERIRLLVGLIQETRSDLVWHPFMSQNGPWGWTVNNAEEFAFGKVSTSSVLYHKWFRNVPWDINAYKYHEPGDWNRFRKFRYLGARVARHPKYLLRHYRERNQKT